MGTRRQDYRDVLKALKRAVLGNHTISVAGETFCCPYEARYVKFGADWSLVRDLARNQMCVFDVGANVGMTALLMGRAVAPGGRVYAFEASERTALILIENANLNRLADRIEVINGLVDSQSGITKRFHWQNYSGHASAARPPRSGNSVGITKVGVSLDQFSADHSLRPTFLKIDVEGAELSVLRGATGLLSNCRPIVFVEVHALADLAVKEHASEILEMVKGYQYRGFDCLTGKSLNEKADLAYMEQVHASSTSTARLLFTPDELPEPRALKDFVQRVGQRSTA